MLNADRRGHQDVSNVYWKRAPPAEANTDTSGFFIKIRPGFQFVITDMHDKSACLPGTEINEWPISKYNLGFEGEPTEVARAAAATAAAGSAAVAKATVAADSARVAAARAVVASGTPPRSRDCTWRLATR